LVDDVVVFLDLPTWRDVLPRTQIPQVYQRLILRAGHQRRIDDARRAVVPTRSPLVCHIGNQLVLPILVGEGQVVALEAVVGAELVGFGGLDREGAGGVQDAD